MSEPPAMSPADDTVPDGSTPEQRPPDLLAPEPTPLAVFLAALDDAKQAASVAEEAFRKEAAARAEALARERAYAWRRADLMAGLAATLADIEDDAMAGAAGQALLRARLGWSSDSAAREDVLARFAPVAVALHRAGRCGAQTEAPTEMPTEAPPDPAAALAAFEDWYLATRESPFWYLFEHYMPETPRVDF